MEQKELRDILTMVRAEPKSVSVLGQILAQNTNPVYLGFLGFRRYCGTERGLN